MDARWSPPLRLYEHDDGRCRLVLTGLACGCGETLQEAGDDLVFNVLNLIAARRASGLELPSEPGPRDVRLLGFLYELGDIAVSGDDIRERLFGAPTPSTAS